jgi:hypothetical protein
MTNLTHCAQLSSLIGIVIITTTTTTINVTRVIQLFQSSYWWQRNFAQWL